MVTRVSGADAAGRSIPIPVRDITPEGGLYDGVDDGCGGVYALLLGYAPENVDRPGIVTDDTSVDLIHVTARGAVRRRAIGASSGDPLRAHLVSVRGRPTIVYHRYQGRRGGIYRRAVGRNDRLTRPRLVRTTGQVEEAAVAAGSGRVVALVSPSRGRSNQLALQDVPLRGQTPASVRVAVTSTRRGDGATLEGQALAVTGRGDVVVRWGRVPRRGYEPDAEYVRLVRGVSPGHTRTLWNCRR